MRRRPPAHNHGRVLLLDPEVVHASGSELRREGCLSVPDYTCDVRRAEEAVVVRILDRVTSARTDIFPRKRYAGPGEHLR